MASKANPRNHRNNPYALFRFRTELFILLMAVCAFLALVFTASWMWALVILAGLVLALFALPWTRRFTVRRAWCVISRHRLQRVFYETRMHTRSGRLSLIWLCLTFGGDGVSGYATIR
jgi:ABC-type multidrug transport system fused ATPase/permease subunit